MAERRIKAMPVDVDRTQQLEQLILRQTFLSSSTKQVQILGIGLNAFQHGIE